MTLSMCITHFLNMPMYDSYTELLVSILYLLNVQMYDSHTVYPTRTKCTHV